ncbi:MAG: DNA-3-methyladenine glycosylase 2 family protein [Ktedonobacteraceae bacterium]|nr:DNA-3-methyladenine glycosylase 2 family protein [Ktedonobacteraceae bacterium]
MTTADFTDLTSAAIAYLRDIDPVMRLAIDRGGPCALQPDSNLFQQLIEAILSQQISVRAAAAITARLKAALPTGEITPDALIALDQDALRALGLSTPKARYVRDLTERVASGQLNLEQLLTLDDEAVITELIAIKGIGRWTAEMLLIFAMGRADVLPVDDLGLLDGVKEAYGLPTRPTRAEMLERGELWRPYRTFATWYMWKWRRTTMGIE